MTNPITRCLPAAAAALALVSPAAHATPDFVLPAVVCVPGNTPTMLNENKPVLTGVVRHQGGRNTPPRLYFCPVFNPDFTTPKPAWGTLRLTYQVNTATTGDIVLRLFAKSRAKLAGDPPLGTTFVVGQVISVPAPGVHVVSAPLSTPLDFHRFSYWFALDIATFTTAAQADVHELQLTK
jgi:hypothetical protein